MGGKGKRGAWVLSLGAGLKLRGANIEEDDVAGWKPERKENGKTKPPQTAI